MQQATMVKRLGILHYQSSYENIVEAARRGTVEDVKFFVEKQGVNVNAKNQYGGTPLHTAALANPNLEVLMYLISQGANANIKDNTGFTPLDLAKTEEKKRILREAME